MAFDELKRVRANEPLPEIDLKTRIDALSDKERERLRAGWESVGFMSPRDDGFFGELGDQFMGASTSALRGLGKTANELGMGSGMQDYFQGVLDRNQQWNRPEHQSTAGYIGGAIGSGLGTTAVALPAMAADTLFGTKGVLTFTTFFAQSFGDNVQRNREAYGPENEAKSYGLAAVESAVDATIENLMGTVPLLGKSMKGLSAGAKRELVKGFFREAEKDLGRAGAKNFFLRLGKASLKNGGEEFTEEGLQYCNSWFWRAIGGDKNNEFSFDELKENMAQGGIAGLAMGPADFSIYRGGRPGPGCGS